MPLHNDLISNLILFHFPEPEKICGRVWMNSPDSHDMEKKFGGYISVNTIVDILKREKKCLYPEGGSSYNRRELNYFIGTIQCSRFTEFLRNLP